MRVVGIDAGKTGAAALYVTAPGVFYGDPVEVADMPLTFCDNTEIVDAVNLVRTLQRWRPDFVWLERVWAMPSYVDLKTGERRQMGAATSFTFGDVYGTIRTTVLIDGWKLRQVASSAWKPWYGLEGPSKAQSRDLVLRLMPVASGLIPLKKHSGRAEAILIARYGHAMEWASAGGSIPREEVAAGLALKARKKTARAASRGQPSLPIVPTARPGDGRIDDDELPPE